uniref:Uncharacterized protein n=1 Tax=Amphimedon queenslandica TaxID=400682 RepID=A0A1X7VGL9_AMPQE
MELGKVRMLKSFFCSDSLGWTKGKHLLKKIDNLTINIPLPEVAVK